MLKHMDPSLVHVFQHLFIFIPFSNMNLLTSLHSIFQHEESLRREEEVEATGLEEEVEDIGLEEDLDENRGQDSKEEEDEGEEGHEDGVGLHDEGVGVTGLLQDPHPHTELGLATSFALL
jgi:hypothetical protein